MLTLYGIPNCDTVKRARAWLDVRGTPYSFHDYKKSGADAGDLRRWIAVLGWQRVLNRSGTTFRKLCESDRAALDAETAVTLMMAHPSMIKRPIAEGGGVLLAGFSADEWAAVL